MSVRDKTEEIVEQGRKARGEYDPKPGSFPVKAYLFWKRHTKHPRGVENFCHYWRVVLIWAPLMAIRVGLRKVGSAIVGLFPKRAPKPRVERTEAEWEAYFAAIDAREREKENSSKWRWVAYRFFRDHGDKVVAVFLGLLIIAMLGALGTAVAWWAPLLAIAVVAAVIGGVIGLSFLVSWFDDRKEAKRQAARDARWAYFEEHGDFPEYVETKGFEFPDWVFRILDPILDALDWVWSKISAFFRGVGDILVLIAQAIRVSKWKICPIVKIPGSEPVTYDELRYY